MSEITAVFDDVKDAVGDKGFLILGAVAVGLFAINLLKKDDNSDATGNTLVQASGYTSYPSVEQNANVIIDSLQNSIDYAQGSIMEQNKEIYEDLSNQNKDIYEDLSDQNKEYFDLINSGMGDMFSNMSDQLGEMGSNIETMNDDMRDYLEKNFTATNNYINNGLQSQMNLINMNNSQLINMINSSYNSMNSKIDDLSKKYPVGNTKKYPVGNTKKAVEIQPEKQMIAGKTSTKNKDAKFFIPVKRDGLNMNKSNVDELKSINVDSRFENRSKNADRNGIKNLKRA